MINFKKKDKGFIALTSVTIMSGFFVLLFAGMFFVAVEEMERVDSREGSVKALSLANSCAEHALEKLRQHVAYNGNESKDIGDDTCQILAVDGTEQMRIIKTVGETGGHTKKIQVEIGAWNHPLLVVLDWREVSDFTSFALEE